MSSTTRRGLLKGVLAGGASFVAAQSAPGHPPARAKAETEATPQAGTPGGPTTAIQYNKGGGNLGGIANFELSSSGVVKIGPSEIEIPPAPASVPRLQLSTNGNFVFVETSSIGTMAAMAFVDNSTTASNRANEEDGFIISRNYMPSGAVAADFSFDGMDIGVSTDAANTQDQSGVYLAGLGVLMKLLSPTTIGNVTCIDAFNSAAVAPGQTQSIGTLIGVYTETLLGDGTNVATYNVNKTVGLNIGTTGFYGPQAGTIAISWGLNIEGPRLGDGTGSITSRMGIRIASQNQGNPGGRNPNSWAIHEDDSLDRNAFGSVNLGGENGPLISTGTGDPNGVVTSVVGGLYLRLDGGSGSTLYVKESGTGNTGWAAK